MKTTKLSILFVATLFVFATSITSCRKHTEEKDEDVSEASDISQIQSLREQAPKHAATKKLLLNMDNLGIYIDNIEGVTFGPDLPNGHKTLIFVSDNNFDKAQKTQLLLFEVD